MGLDPQIVTGVPEHHIISALIEGLVTENKKNLNPEPGTAERWETSEDGLVWKFHLREDAKWSNGDPVTATDFVQSYQRMLTPSLGSQYAYMLHVVKNAEAYNSGKLKDFSQVGFEAINDKQLNITLKAPTPYFLSLLNHYSWFPVHIPTIKKHGGIDKPDNRWTLPGNFVGNGPFILDKWEINKVIVVKKSSTYWDRKTVKLEEIHFHPISDVEVEERAFRSGQIHVSNTIPLNKIEVYRKKDAGKLRIDTYLGTYFYRLNTKRKPLDDKRVRMALALAVDRESIVRNIHYRTVKVAGNITPPGTGGYTYQGSPLKYDPDKARQLLAEAGFPGGQGFPKLSVLYNSSEQHRRMAEVIQQMWKKNLGIEIELANEEWKVYLKTSQEMDYDISRAGWIGDYPDANTFLDMWLTDGGNNYTGFSLVEYDKLIADAANAPSVEARLALFQKAEGLLMEEMPILPIYFYTARYLINPRVREWHPTILNHHPYKHVYLAPAE
tara:strand:- start:2173 stop:3663 length:1491 start_codon:yes stop_codon:yes gene_type:complete